jgi:hypothetical protein
MALSRKQLYAYPAPKLKLHRNDSVEFEDAPPLLEEMPAVRPGLGDLIYPDVVSRQACFWGGLVFGIIGSVELFYPEAAGARPSQYHSLFYLAAGALLALPAMMLPPRPLARVSSSLGLVLAMLGFLGFLVGAPPEEGIGAYGLVDRFHWALLPGKLELSTKDHMLLEVVGVTLFLVGLRTKKPARSRPQLLDISIK